MGSVAFDERLLERVRRGQQLADILAPQWLEAQQEYLALLDSQSERGRSVRDAARQRLAVLGVPASRGRPTTLVAPIDGVVTELAFVAMPGEPQLVVPSEAVITTGERSVAAAHVSGIAALMRELRPNMSNEAVREVLVNTSAQQQFASGTARTLVNACAALAQLIGSSECPAALGGASAYLHPDADLRR